MDNAIKEAITNQCPFSHLLFWLDGPKGKGWLTAGSYFGKVPKEFQREFTGSV